MTTRLKVAKAGGRTIAKDILSLRVAGIKGCNKTKELFGISYYHELGKKRRCRREINLLLGIL